MMLRMLMAITILQLQQVYNSEVKKVYLGKIMVNFCGVCDVILCETKIVQQSICQMYIL